MHSWMGSKQTGRQTKATYHSMTRRRKNHTKWHGHTNVWMLMTNRTYILPTYQCPTICGDGINVDWFPKLWLAKWTFRNSNSTRDVSPTATTSINITTRKNWGNTKICSRRCVTVTSVSCMLFVSMHLLSCCTEHNTSNKHDCKLQLWFGQLYIPSSIRRIFLLHHTVCLAVSASCYACVFLLIHLTHHACLSSIDPSVCLPACLSACLSVSSLYQCPTC